MKSGIFRICGWLVATGICPSGVFGQTFSVLYTFPAVARTNYYYASQFGPGQLMLAGDKLYGATAMGGSNDTGIVFSMKVDGSNFVTLHTFTALSTNDGSNVDGATSVGPMTLSEDTLYGTAFKGGANGSGALFSLKTNGDNFSAFYSFTTDTNVIWGTNADGAHPDASLVVLEGMIYSAVSRGGSNGEGTVFSVSTSGSAFNTLKTFDAIPRLPFFPPALPGPGLTQSSNVFYGVKLSGGTNSGGYVYSVKSDGSQFTILKTLDPPPNPNVTNVSGANPNGALVLFGNKLYGTTTTGGEKGGGVVFSMNTDGSAYTILHNFSGGVEGSNPYCSLQSSEGTLYGTTRNGGTNGTGTVFSIRTDGGEFTTLHSFAQAGNLSRPSGQTYSTNADGAYPRAGLVLSGRTLYGSTAEGGRNGEGVIFSLKLPPPAPSFSGIVRAGSDITLSIGNCLAGASYVVLKSANAALPLNQWTPTRTNVPPNDGQVSITLTNEVNSALPGAFYSLRVE